MEYWQTFSKMTPVRLKPTTFDYVSSDELKGQCTIHCVTELLLRESRKTIEQEKLPG